MECSSLDTDETRPLSGISFRSGAYRKSVDEAPIISQLEVSKKDRKKKDNQGSKIAAGFGRRLSTILSVGDKIGDASNHCGSSSDTTPMITKVTPAPLKKGFTRRGLREKQAALQRETLASMKCGLLDETRNS
jgi:hypothetical protein